MTQRGYWVTQKGYRWKEMVGKGKVSRDWDGQCIINLSGGWGLGWSIFILDFTVGLGWLGGERWVK